MAISAVRRPVVAGKFYPAKAEELLRDLDRYLGADPAASEQRDEVEGAIACVVPHAGYMYSGHVAGAVYRRLPRRSSYIVLAPNHAARGEPLAIMSSPWQTPLGEIPIDTKLAQALRDACLLVREDSAAHELEHSLEVQLPFLQRKVGQFQFVPVSIGTGSYGALESLGHGVAHAVRHAERPVLIIASSDMNHYEPDSLTRIKDRKAIDKVLALDPPGLYEVVRSEGISMCGYGPAVAMLVAAKDLGARQGQLVKYATSADTGGDRTSVVGYAGIIVS